MAKNLQDAQELAKREPFFLLIKWSTPAVTDRYAVYRSFQDHQFCLAYLIREFKGYGEREGPDKTISLALENELRLSCKIHREYREGKISIIPE